MCRTWSSSGIGDQLHQEGALTQHGGGEVSPLDQGHGPVLDQLTQPQVHDLVEMVESVDVGMEKSDRRPTRRPTGRSRSAPA